MGFRAMLEELDCAATRAIINDWYDNFTGIEITPLVLETLPHYNRVAYHMRQAEGGCYTCRYIYNWPLLPNLVTAERDTGLIYIDDYLHRKRRKV